MSSICSMVEPGPGQNKHRVYNCVHVNRLWTCFNGKLVSWSFYKSRQPKNSEKKTR